MDLGETENLLGSIDVRQLTIAQRIPNLSVDRPRGTKPSDRLEIENLATSDALNIHRIGVCLSHRNRYRIISMSNQRAICRIP